MNNTEIIKTAQMEQRIDNFIQTVDCIEDMVEAETLDTIKGLLEMNTIRNWGLLVKMVFDQMKWQMAAKIGRQIKHNKQLINKEGVMTTLIHYRTAFKHLKENLYK